MPHSFNHIKYSMCWWLRQHLSTTTASARWQCIGWQWANARCRIRQLPSNVFLTRLSSSTDCARFGFEYEKNHCNQFGFVKIIHMRYLTTYTTKAHRYTDRQTHIFEDQLYHKMHTTSRLSHQSIQQLVRPQETLNWSTLCYTQSRQARQGNRKLNSVTAHTQTIHIHIE